MPNKKIFTRIGIIGAILVAVLIVLIFTLSSISRYYINKDLQESKGYVEVPEDYEQKPFDSNPNIVPWVPKEVSEEGAKILAKDAAIRAFLTEAPPECLSVTFLKKDGDSTTYIVRELKTKTCGGVVGKPVYVNKFSINLKTGDASWTMYDNEDDSI